MAVLAASIADTIAGMQKVLNKDQYSSESDEPYLQPSNRGNKLKRKARFISSGPDGRVNGPRSYRKTIKHAGYTRDIIRRNPKRYDEDGNELATDDDDEDADARAAEESPYAGIRLEHLLMPLTSAAGLSNHSSMSVPYRSKTLSDMAQHACEIVQRERKTLSNAKKMLTNLRGDGTWIPCGMLETIYDEKIFDTGKVYETIISNAPATGNSDGSDHRTNDTEGEPNLTNDIPKPEPQSTDVPPLRNGNGNPPPPMKGLAPNASEEGPDSLQAGKLPEIDRAAEGAVKPEGANDADEEHHIEGVEMMADTEAAPIQDLVPQESNHGPSQEGVPSPPAEANTALPSVEEGSAEEDAAQKPESIDEKTVNEEQEANGGSQSPPRRITRAQAQAEKLTASTRSPSPDNFVPPPIHPLFLIPSTAKPNPDFGLPPTEAEETRRMLAAYVQKQEEVCRGAEKLYEGLLLADRQRRTVFRWCKAEGHVGEMSDGEDWYDKEEWGLEEDLRKGHMEEEEDTVVQGKKTRGRRA